MNMKINNVEAMAKSKTFAITAAMGNTSLGKYIFVTRFLFPTKLLVANRIEPTKKDYGSALTVTDNNSDISIGFPEKTDIPFLISKPAETTIIGMKIAQRKPIAVCL
jgi:hypothetical protein